MKSRCEIVNRSNHEILVRIPVEGSVKMYEKVYDSDGKKIGKIVRILGPVAKPYGVVKVEVPDTGDFNEVYTR